MRLIKERMDDAAATEAMRGGAIGALKYCTVALFAGGVLTAVSPKFAAIKPPQKVPLSFPSSQLALIIIHPCKSKKKICLVQLNHLTNSHPSSSLQTLKKQQQLDVAVRGRVLGRIW